MDHRRWLDRRSLLRAGLATAATTFGLGGVSLLAQRPDTRVVTREPLPDADTLDLTPGDVCTLTCSQTLGPCYYSQGAVARQDITEGTPGLPMRMGFLVVNADTCEPMENVAIDIWHTNAAGLYSGPISTMCTLGNAVAQASTWLRGIQTTDKDGWAHFSSVFPGWYSSRTVHIHASVRLNNSSIVTTQFYFPDAFTNAIYSSFAPYSSRPNRDTTNTTDNILGGSLTRMAPYMFTPKLILEKSLVVLKVIAIRGSATSCNA